MMTMIKTLAVLTALFAFAVWWNWDRDNFMTMCMATHDDSFVGELKCAKEWERR
jgi:hypothetical protein